MKTLLILGRKHTVRWNARMPSDRWGDYDHEKALIRIAKAPRRQQQEALLHEVLHAVEAQYGFEMDHDHLTLLARGVLMTLKDNKGLLELLIGDGDG